MFGHFGPNILSFVWISTLLLFYVDGNFSLIFYAIDLKPWHNDLGRCAMSFLSHKTCSSEFIHNFLDQYVHHCRSNGLHVGRSPLMNLDY